MSRSIVTLKLEYTVGKLCELLKSIHRHLLLHVTLANVHVTVHV